MVAESREVKRANGIVGRDERGMRRRLGWKKETARLVYHVLCIRRKHHGWAFLDRFNACGNVHIYTQSLHLGFSAIETIGKDIPTSHRILHYHKLVNLDAQYSSLARNSEVVQKILTNNPIAQVAILELSVCFPPAMLYSQWSVSTRPSITPYSLHFSHHL